MPGGGIGGLGTALYFMRQEERRVNELVRRHRRRMSRKGRRIGAGQRGLEDRLDEAEADLGRTLLLAMTVDRILVQKRILTSDEIARVAKQLDLVDGVADGKLDPAAVRPEGAVRSDDSDGPEEFLRRLEREGR
jgi:hypothetical protein